VLGVVTIIAQQQLIVRVRVFTIKELAGKAHRVPIVPTGVIFPSHEASAGVKEPGSKGRRS